MILRLITDAVWRTRLMYLWMFPIVLLLWAIVAYGDAPIAMGLTLSLTLAYAFGPIASITAVGLREVRVLPVTNRELWLTTWATSTLVGPLFLLVVQLLAATGVQAITGSTAVTAEALLLSTVYAFAYAGTLLSVGPLLGYASNNIESRRPRWVWIALTVACFLVFIGGFGFPWLVAADLPVAIDQFTAPTAMALAACLLVTGGAWAWTPRRGGIVTGNQAARRVGAASTPRRRPRFADRFTGIARIAWSHGSLTVVTSLIVIVAFAAYWALFVSDEGLRAFMQRAALLPFDSPFQTDRDDFRGMTILVAFMAVAGNGVWNPLARQLKALPLTVREINGLFLATPLATWTLIWIVLIITHRAVTGSFPGTLRLDVLVLAGGTSALGHTLALRFQRGAGVPWIFMPFGIATSILTKSVGSAPSGWASLALMMTGLTALGLAALVNHRTLTRSTSSANAYQRRQIAPKISGPVAPQ